MKRSKTKFKKELNDTSKVELGTYTNKGIIEYIYDKYRFRSSDGNVYNCITDSVYF
jgi:hypothetical protein